MERFQKARKDHKCDSCGKKIPKGDKYWRHYDDEDGSVTSIKEHSNCLLYDNEETSNDC